MRSYFRYWGKTSENGNYHLLPYHCLDVAAVAWVLLDPGRPRCRRLAEHLTISPNQLQHWFSFFISLHDIGKFATAFQGVVSGLSIDLVSGNRQRPYTERHDSLGYQLWVDEDGLRDRVCKAAVFPGKETDTGSLPFCRTLDLWMQIVTGHHGIPPKTTPMSLADHFTKQDQTAAYQFVQGVGHLFLSDCNSEVLADKAFLQCLKSTSWVLAGITVLADWLGSSRPPESYHRHETSLDEYWHQHALPFAIQVLDQAKLEPTQVASFNATNHLFPFIKMLTPLQKWAESRELPARNQLFILEDVTGAGKTEAALTLAHRLIADELAEGLYVALPTMATANAMYERLRGAYRRMYAKEALPSLVLAHGARHLSDGFRQSFALPKSQSAKDDYDRAEETAEGFCSAWLADSRKKALLAEVGVGTLDQALLAVLPARHQSLRCLGLARKVLIVDEVHAYDPYMSHLLQRLLEYHAAQKGSAILLSATLPHATREQFLQAFASGTGVNAPPSAPTRAYPLASHFPTTEPMETAVATRREVQRTLPVVLLDSAGQAENVIKSAVEQGKCVCWVRNTVGDAIKAYRAIANFEWMDEGRLTLFHSRFAMVDRQRIESAAMGHFGKESTAEMRRGRVLIATQVVEQSLDLDFDVMISDLAPIDLLIQRAGRQHRHVRDSAGNLLDEPVAVDQREDPIFYLVGPPVSDEPATNWLKASLPGTQAVYQHVGQLWLTQQLLHKAGRLSMPFDARDLIEGVYGEAAQEAIPEALLDLTWKAVGEDSGKLSMANLNVLNLSKGYCRASSTGGGWDDESRIPTRLGDDSVQIALAVPEGTGWRPYAEVEDFAWEMSMLSVPKRQWQRAREMIPAEVATAFSELKDEYKTLKWVELFPLDSELKAWYGEAIGWGIFKEDADESD